MKPSLSMILPVRNAQANAAALVAQALEVLPELTPRWDLLIVDDGSTDATPEIVEELTRSYPQVAVIHHSAARGESACFRAGARRTQGEILLLRAADCNLELSGLHKMWKRIAAHDLVVARSAGERAAAWPTALTRRRVENRVGQGVGLQMIRRRALEAWLASNDNDLQQYLARKGYPQHEVELRSASPALSAASNRRAAEPVASPSNVTPQHCDRGDALVGPRRPNYLSRLKAFALGE